jgi:hypothetical protein
MRKAVALFMALMTLLAINVPVAQCSTTSDIYVDHPNCPSAAMAVMPRCKMAGNPACCPMDSPKHMPCHMTIIHRVWNAGSAVNSLPPPILTPLYSLEAIPAIPFGRVKMCSTDEPPVESSPPILISKCTLNI